jgi:hypothetical protein
MGLYTSLLRINPAELAVIDRQTLHRHFLRSYAVEVDNDVLKIDKSREGIVFLLTHHLNQQSITGPNEKWFNGKEIAFPVDDFDDTVYWQLSPDEVKELHRLLAQFNDAQLQKNFNPEKMMQLGIYPYVWDRGNEAYDYLYAHLKALKVFIADAALHSMAVVITTG